jgi:hypothetical protein
MPLARKEKPMIKRIVKLSRDPFSVDLGKEGGWYFIDSRTGDVLFGCAAFHASNGLTFSLTPEQTGYLLKLQSRECTFDIGWTDDADAANWVEAVNRFLETKGGAAAPTNGMAMPTTPAASTAS